MKVVEEDAKMTPIARTNSADASRDGVDEDRRLRLEDNVNPWLIFSLAILLMLAGAVFASTTIMFAQGGALTWAQFYSAALPQCVALVGTGLTCFTSATVLIVQRRAALEVALFNRQAGEDLQRLKAQADQQLDHRKRQSETEKAAYLDLVAAATVYFHAVRALCGGKYDPKLSESAEAGCIQAAKHLIYVDGTTEALWHAHWTDARYILREASSSTTSDERTALAKKLADEVGQDELTFYTRFGALKQHVREELVKQKNHPQVVGGASVILELPTGDGNKA